MPRIPGRSCQEDRQILIDAAGESTRNHIEKWEQAVAEAVETATNDMGVTFIEDVDKDAFRSATADMIESYKAQYPKVGDVLDIINSVE